MSKSKNSVKGKSNVSNTRTGFKSITIFLVIILVLSLLSSLSSFL